MEVLFNIINLKSLITFVHLAGLAFGVGGAWVLDGFLLKHSRKVITLEKYQIIEFVSKFVMTGILILWFSGLAFLAYYYLWTPEYLANEKVWAKTVIVFILSLNGYFVHTQILPKLKACIGTTLTQSLSRQELRTMTFIATVSFVSWLFPIILGVSKSLNFTVPAFHILAFYFLTLVVAAAIADWLSDKVLFGSGSAPEQTSSHSA